MPLGEPLPFYATGTGFRNGEILLWGGDLEGIVVSGQKIKLP